MIRLLEQNLLDSVTEAHYAYHKSLRTVTGKHDHDFFELFLITKGSLVHQINGRREQLREGALVFIRPSDVHWYENDGASEGELLNLAFTSSTMAALRRYLGAGFDVNPLLDDEWPPAASIDKHEIDTVKARFQMLTLYQSNEKDKIKTNVRALLAEIFTKYLFRKPRQQMSDLPDWLEALQEAMRKKEHFTAGLSRLYELSQKSPEHASRMIKKYMGRTPTEWINELRLQYSANLLIHTDQPIIDISMEVGFENLSHYYHRFKRYYGSSPAQYRKMNRKVLIP